MKRIFFIAVFFFCVSLGFSQAEDDISFDDDLLFSESEDIVVEQSDASEYVSSKQTLKIGTSEYFIPLKFTGHFESDFGYYGTKHNQNSENNEFKNSVYFDLANYIYFMARLDKTLSVRGTTSVKFPPKKDSIKLDELYFDYLIWDRIYITAGKKETTWGYTRLFSGENAYSLYTDRKSVV